MLVGMYAYINEGLVILYFNVAYSNKNDNLAILCQ